MGGLSSWSENALSRVCGRALEGKMLQTARCAVQRPYALARRESQRAHSTLENSPGHIGEPIVALQGAYFSKARCHDLTEQLVQR